MIVVDVCLCYEESMYACISRMARRSNGSPTTEPVKTRKMNTIPNQIEKMTTHNTLMKSSLQSPLEILYKCK